MASIRSGIGEFQSTLPREERLFHNCFEHVFNYFNPRSHERSDTMPTPIKLSRSHISIHAPTRGATSSVVCLNSSMRNFNPRSHERSDSSRRSNHKCKANFNPRSHERSDTRPSPHPWCRLRISIHAPTRGATSWHISLLNPVLDFNPRSHERSDSYTKSFSTDLPYFNPRSHERSDQFAILIISRR